MKFLKATKDNLFFHIHPEGRAALRMLVGHYPVMDASHFELSKFSDPDEIEEDREFLQQSLTEEQQINRNQVRAIIADTERFHETEGGFVLRLSLADVELLLQALNDVRIGFWIRLGSPDDGTEMELRSDPESAPLLATMQVCGFFQGALLDGLRRQKKPSPLDDEGLDPEIWN